MDIKIKLLSGCKISNKEIIELSNICNYSFGINVNLKEHYSHIVDNDSIILIYDTDKLIGFIGYVLIYDIIYLNSIIIEPKYEGLGIIKKVIKNNILKYNNKYILFKTNNSRLVYLFEKLKFKVFYGKKGFIKFKKIGLFKKILLILGLNYLNSDGIIEGNYINLFKDEKINFMGMTVSKKDSFICLIEK